jgi:hypothetical protein
MPYQQLRANRNNYDYPAVALDGNLGQFNVVHFGSMTALDNYIHNLIVSPDQHEKILGYLSVIFWGFYSGQDGVIRENRALGRVNLAYNGRDRVVRGNRQRIRGVIDHGFDVVTNHINCAIRFIEQDQYSDALMSLSNLPQLQVAFASKVCAFIDPNKCGVIDSVIASKYPSFGFAINDDGIVTNTNANRQRYHDYCVCLQHMAEQVNQHINDFRWTDRDGQLYDWRALDVERAMY